MSFLGGNEDKAKLAAFLLLTSPGTPFIYYGEEIGMTGQKPDENIRRPMQWTAQANGGFSSVSPWEPMDPGYVDFNVQKQQGAFDSLLTTYQNLIALRNAHPSLSRGDFYPVDATNTGVYAFLRSSDSETVLIVVNLTKNSIRDYSLGFSAVGLKSSEYQLTDLLSGKAAANLTLVDGKIEKYQPLQELSPYSGFVFKFGNP